MYTPCARLQCRPCVCPFGTFCIHTHLLRVINCARIGRPIGHANYRDVMHIIPFYSPTPITSLTSRSLSLSLFFSSCCIEVTPSVPCCETTSLRGGGPKLQIIILYIYYIPIDTYVYVCAVIFMMYTYCIYLQTMLCACERFQTNGVNIRQ